MVFRLLLLDGWDCLWVREYYIRKQLLPCQPFLLLNRSVEDKEKVILSADSDQYPEK